MRKSLLVGLLCLVFLTPAVGQRNNTFNVIDAPGATVGSKVTYVQDRLCNSSYTCVVVFDPLLEKSARGVLPGRCAKCVWQDPSGAFGGTSFTSLAVGATVPEPFKAKYGDYQSITAQFVGPDTAVLQFRGTPDATGYEHSRIVSWRDPSRWNYGTNLSFHTEGKNSGTTDTATEKLRIDADGTVSLLATDALLRVGNGTVRFPFLQGGTYLGYAAGSAAVGNGTYNTFVGYENGKATSTGYNNVGVGFQALQANTTGWDNTAIGLQTLFTNTVGAFNTAVGIHAGYSLTDGSSNTAIGTGALQLNVNGSENVAVGLYAGKLNLGSGNVFIGTKAGYNTAGSNQLVIANGDTGGLITGDFAGKTVHVDGRFDAYVLNQALRTPASSSEACYPGDMAQDASYVYVCVATNTWKRAALVAF